MGDVVRDVPFDVFIPSAMICTTSTCPIVHALHSRVLTFIIVAMFKCGEGEAVKLLGRIVFSHKTISRDFLGAGNLRICIHL